MRFTPSPGILVALAMGLLGARAGEPGYVNPDGSIAIVGYNDMDDLIARWDPLVEASHPGIRFKPDLPSTRSAPPALARGASLLAPMGAEMSEDQLAPFIAADGRPPVAVRVAHAKGYRISNGGLTVTGIKLAYWHYLWSSGQRDLADRFAQSALTPDLTNGNAILGDIPDSSEPGRPILANNRPMRAKLARVERLLAGYPSTGIDYVNIHWYESGPEELAEVTNWLSRATGLPVICNEMGQFSYSPETVTALLSEAESLRMAYIFWFANDGRGRARGLAGEDDTPGENGMAFRAFVTSH